ncbi:hypothetical protein Tco_1122738 [Tanacetum coccineum]|uniref:Uncharacterized protein n=1 Tax=Tanacetum coccineum TaxID=301880 RepID=A0ABQ5J1D5_9ASTR
MRFRIMILRLFCLLLIVKWVEKVHLMACGSFLRQLLNWLFRGVWMVMETRVNHHPKLKFLTSTFKANADASPPKHAVAFVNGDQYYGAKASINVWTLCHSYWLSLVSDLLGKHSDLMEGFSSFWERCENIGMAVFTKKWSSVSDLCMFELLDNSSQLEGVGDDSIADDNCLLEVHSENVNVTHVGVSSLSKCRDLNV